MTDAIRSRPILFSAPMVRAILDGTKTQTRRVFKARHDFDVEDGRAFFRWYVYAESEPVEVPCPYGKAGDRLYVKETWGLSARAPVDTRDPDWVWYRADNPGDHDLRDGRWRPSIYMPRWASRITLEIVDVRVERLRDITPADALAEGIDRAQLCQCVRSVDGLCDICEQDAVTLYRDLWSSINGPESWAANPWVWVVTFRRVEVSR